MLIRGPKRTPNGARTIKDSGTQCVLELLRVLGKPPSQIAAQLRTRTGPRSEPLETLRPQWEIESQQNLIPAQHESARLRIELVSSQPATQRLYPVPKKTDSTVLAIRSANEEVLATITVLVAR
jgi:hypothetical protein